MGTPVADIQPAGAIAMLTVQAPAKINLTLEVLDKRQDGFHEIRSVMQTISLGDSLCFKSGQHIAFESNLPGWLAADSLVSRATSLLQRATGCSQGASIEVTKHIPLSSGLGGDSSDAAAVLRGLNQLWQLGLSSQQLLELARQLGSDVAFFLYGGTARLEGRGEIVTPLPPLPHRWVVLVIPPVPRLPEKTKRLYDSLRATDYTDGQITRKLVEAIKAGQEFTPSLLCNTFENVASARFPGLDACRERMRQAGATNVHLAGSGPTLFTLLKDKAQAEGLYTRFKQQKLESYLAETLTSLEKIT